MSSTEVLEVNVVAIRGDLNELKNDFRAAIARIDNDIKAAVTRLEAEIRAMASKFEADLRSRTEKIESDMRQMSARIDAQLAEMRQDMRDMREDMREMRTDDKALRNVVDSSYKELSATLGTLDRKVTNIESKLTALLWVVGGLGTFITLAITVGKAFHLF